MAKVPENRLRGAAGAHAWGTVTFLNRMVYNGVVLRQVRPHLTRIRLFVTLANVLAGAFAAYTLKGSSNLNPFDDLSGCSPAARRWGDYIYYVSFGRGAISVLLVCLVLTTMLMLITDGSRDGQH